MHNMSKLVNLVNSHPQETDCKKDLDPVESDRLSLWCLPSGTLRFGGNTAGTGNVSKSPPV